MKINFADRETLDSVFFYEPNGDDLEDLDALKENLENMVCLLGCRLDVSQPVFEAMIGADSVTTFLVDRCEKTDSKISFIDDDGATLKLPPVNVRGVTPRLPGQSIADYVFPIVDKLCTDHEEIQINGAGACPSCCEHIPQKLAAMIEDSAASCPHCSYDLRRCDCGALLMNDGRCIDCDTYNVDFD